MKKSNRTIHPHTPAKTRRTLRSVKKELGQHNLREVARRLGVNIKYVSNLVTNGIEPTDQTENGQEVRVLLGLPRRKRKAYTKRPPQPAWLLTIRRGIRRMSKETKRAVLIDKEKT